ncbi:SufS family cysteine desulfurase [Ruminococcaceae bacterium OttesenSCG-928-A16]|nr:SufS family cysteine desulfurase [Ruminococcaceae bacterium OttesenSCG-928-A16]
MKQYRKDFPTLQMQAHGKPIVYLDSAATSQRPVQVLQAMDDFYRTCGASPHRGIYSLAEKATLAYEEARATTAKFVGVHHPEEIIFTRNASEALNLIAYCYAPMVLQKGDKVVIPISEHHSNLIPWQRATKAAGATLEYLYLNENGEITDAEIAAKITPGTKIVAFAQVSNVLGSHLPVQKLVAAAKAVGAATVLDCAQSVPHFKIDLPELDVDFAVFSGHKMYAPLGIGVLYGKKQLLNAMPPFLSGGDMIEYVQEQETSWAPLPQKFEAGTQNVGGAIGLAAAIEYIETIGWPAIEAHEKELMTYLMEGLAKMPHVHIVGNPNPTAPRYGVVAFTISGVHPHDVASILDTEGVCIRAGHHCAQPLMHYLGQPATCRASLGLYNNKADIDALLAAIPKARRLLGYAD